MRINNDKEFEDLLIQNGWTLPNGKYSGRVAPYDPTVVCYAWRREFRKDGFIIGIIQNMRDIIWDYDTTTGLINNGVFAVRIK